MSELVNEPLAQSHIFYGDKCFFVSTINRQSSSALGGNHIYSETLVWNWDVKKRERQGYILHQAEGAKNSIKVHQSICQYLFEHGKPPEEQA